MTNTFRPDWDLFGLILAGAVSLRADCTRRRVGAVIMDPQNRVVSTGYNGAPSGEPGCLSGACPRGQLSYDQLAADSSYGNCIAIHAEENAIIWARTDLRGHTLYCTDTPCHQCSKTIRNVGIARIVTPADLSSKQEKLYRAGLKVVARWAARLGN